MNAPLDIPMSLSRTQRYVLEQFLMGMLQRINGAQGAMLATADGFPAAFAGALDETMQNRVAAVVSSLCALGEAAGAQIEAGTLEVISLQFSDRQMQVVSIRGERSDYVLALVARADVLLGSSLWAIRECATQIRESLRP